MSKLEFCFRILERVQVIQIPEGTLEPYVVELRQYAVACIKESLLKGNQEINEKE